MGTSATLCTDDRSERKKIGTNAVAIFLMHPGQLNTTLLQMVTVGNPVLHMLINRAVFLIYETYLCAFYFNIAKDQRHANPKEQQ